MKTKYFILIVLSFYLIPAACALDVTGLNQPESVVWDAKSGNYFISNVNGEPLDRDNNGYISKVNADGLVVVLKFIQPKEEESELHAPKGMTILDDTLYVSDLDAIRPYDLTSGEAKPVIDLSRFEPQFLNDLTHDPDGNLFVSDMNGNQILKLDPLKPKGAKIFLSGDTLGKPNGLFYDHHRRRLVVVTWDSGEVLEVTDEGNIETLKTGLKHLDGVFVDHKKNLIVSSYMGGEIYKITDLGRGELTLLQSGLNTPADIAYNQESHELLIPLMSENRVSSIEL